MIHLTFTKFVIPLAFLHLSSPLVPARMWFGDRPSSWQLDVGKKTNTRWRQYKNKAKAQKNSELRGNKQVLLKRLELLCSTAQEMSCPAWQGPLCSGLLSQPVMVTLTRASYESTDLDPVPSEYIKHYGEQAILGLS